MTTRTTFQAFRPSEIIADGRRLVSYAFDLRHLGAGDSIREAVLEFGRGASATRVLDVSGHFAYGELRAAGRRDKARVRLGRLGLSDLREARGAYFWVQHEAPKTGPAGAEGHPPRLQLEVASTDAALLDEQLRRAA